jgi:phosphatidylserine decarboxylase
MKKIVISSVSVIVLLGSFVLFFNRAPERTIPEIGITSPASGKVIAIIPTNTPTITFEKQGIINTVEIPELTGSMNMILIEMNPMDVHVQRAPISGKIIDMEHYNGKHINAIGKDKLTILNSNEKTVTVFKNETDTVGVIQVAGKAARRIRNFVKTGDNLSKGQVYGRIILGSQVVVIVPSENEVQVKIGDRVVDGQTILFK